MTPPMNDDSERGLHVLVVSPDPALEEEFVGAMADVSMHRSLVASAPAFRSALEAARRRTPAIVFVELMAASTEVLDFLKDLREVTSSAVVVGVVPQEVTAIGRLPGADVISLMRAGVRDFVNRPLASTELRDVLDRVVVSARPESAARYGHVAAFLGSKGGVGRSALAVNVACRLAQWHADEVLLIDASLQSGACALMLDLATPTTIVDAVRERERLDRTLLRHLALRHDSGLRLLAAPSDPLEAAEVDDEAMLRIVTMAHRSFRYVIVDTGLSLDNVLMAILDATDTAWVVTQGTVPAVGACARLLPTLEGLGLPASRTRVIVNAPQPSFFGEFRPVDVADRLQRDVDHVVPYDRRVGVSMNTGVPPIFSAHRWQRLGRAITGISESISAAGTTSVEADVARGRR